MNLDDDGVIFLLTAIFRQMRRDFMIAYRGHKHHPDAREMSARYDAVEYEVLNNPWICLTNIPPEQVLERWKKEVDDKYD